MQTTGAYLYCDRYKRFNVSHSALIAMHVIHCSDTAECAWVSLAHVHVVCDEPNCAMVF